MQSPVDFGDPYWAGLPIFAQLVEERRADTVLRDDTPADVEMLTRLRDSLVAM